MRTYFNTLHQQQHVRMSGVSIAGRAAACTLPTWLVSFAEAGPDQIGSMSCNAGQGAHQPAVAKHTALAHIMRVQLAACMAPGAWRWLLAIASCTGPGSSYVCTIALLVLGDHPSAVLTLAKSCSDGKMGHLRSHSSVSACSIAGMLQGAAACA